MKEAWKDIEGYEGLYQVSSHGMVRRLPGKVWNGRCYANKQGGILKQAYTRGRYLMVGLCKNNKVKHFRVNRLVAEAFIPNPGNLPHAGHLDDNKENNRADNLYWTTAAENNTHNDKHIRVGQRVGKPIVGISGKRKVRYNSSLEAARAGFNDSAIRNCLRGIAKTHKGYSWKHA